MKARLREYVDDHLRFLTDFRIDFTNNLAERGLRKIKTKLKIAGGFRNLNFAKYYCDAISIIDTCKKQKINIEETIKNIFIGKKKIFAFWLLKEPSFQRKLLFLFKNHYPVTKFS